MRRVSDRCIYCEFVAYVDIMMIVIKGTSNGTKWMDSPSSVAQEDGFSFYHCEESLMKTGSVHLT